MPARLTVVAAAINGVTIDSVIALFFNDMSSVTLNDDGFDGDFLAGDSLWSAFSDTIFASGMYQMQFHAYAHAGVESYHVQSGMSFIVSESVVGEFADSVVTQPVDTDTNTLYDRLDMIFYWTADSSALKICSTKRETSVAASSAMTCCLPAAMACCPPKLRTV